MQGSCSRRKSNRSCDPIARSPSSSPARSPVLVSETMANTNRPGPVVWHAAAGRRTSTGSRHPFASSVRARAFKYAGRRDDGVRTGGRARGSRRARCCGGILHRRVPRRATVPCTRSPAASRVADPSRAAGEPGDDTTVGGRTTMNNITNVNGVPRLGQAPGTKTTSRGARAPGITTAGTGNTAGSTGKENTGILAWRHAWSTGNTAAPASAGRSGGCLHA